jgi:hypothetical protein
MKHDVDQIARNTCAAEPDLTHEQLKMALALLAKHATNPTMRAAVALTAEQCAKHQLAQVIEFNPLFILGLEEMFGTLSVIVLYLSNRRVELTARIVDKPS